MGNSHITRAYLSNRVQNIANGSHGWNSDGIIFESGILPCYVILSKKLSPLAFAHEISEVEMHHMHITFKFLGFGRV